MPEHKSTTSTDSHQPTHILLSSVFVVQIVFLTFIRGNNSSSFSATRTTNIWKLSWTHCVQAVHAILQMRNQQDKCWKYTSATTTDTLQLYVSVGPISYSILWQRCAYDLIWFNEKKQNKVKGWKNTMFCLKYLLWSTQTRRCFTQNIHKQMETVPRPHWKVPAVSHLGLLHCRVKLVLQPFNNVYITVPLICGLQKHYLPTFYPGDWADEFMSTEQNATSQFELCAQHRCESFHCARLLPGQSDVFSPSLERGFAFPQNFPWIVVHPNLTLTATHTSSGTRALTGDI